MRQIPLPEPLADALQIHCLDLREGADDAWSLLSPMERLQAGRYRFSADRLRFTATRAAARTLLGRRLGCAPEAVDIVAGRHRKPEVRGVASKQLCHPPLFNVSHSGGIALIAIGDTTRLGCLGVDVEQCDADLDPHPLAKLCCTPHEMRQLEDAADALHRFYSIWVAKEAALKAVGVGISEHLQSISIDIQPGRPVSLRSCIPAWRCLRARLLDVPGGYFAAVSWSDKADGAGDQAPRAAQLAAAIQEQT